MCLRPLAPAIHHRFASSLISCTRALTLGEAPSKRQAFLCFQIHHATNTTNELNPLRCCFWICCIAWRHHSMKLSASRPSLIGAIQTTLYSLFEHFGILKICSSEIYWQIPDLQLLRQLVLCLSLPFLWGRFFAIDISTVHAETYSI